MPADRTSGMDHPHYEWSPISERSRLLWPRSARLALVVMVGLEHMEWQPPKGSYTSPILSGGTGRRPYPDYGRLTHREYGHRVGVFRVLDVLARYGIPPTVAIDALTAEHYPALVAHCQGAGAEFVAHGMSASRMITSCMTIEEERDYIESAASTISEATGQRPTGWFGPEYGESERTPALLAEAGFNYVCDWVNDEQPYAMSTPRGSLTALPVLLELDDVNAMFDRKVPFSRWGRMVTEAFEVLYVVGAAIGRLMVLNLHPWLVGQPFRIGTLDRALAAITARDAVWAATGAQVVSWFAAQQADEARAD